MRRGDGVQDEVELVGMGRHLFRVGGDAHLVGAQPLAVRYLAGGGGEQHHMGAHRMRDLDAHVAEAAEPDDPDLLAGPRTPVAQRRVGGDAGAQQRGDAGQVLLVMFYAQDKGFLDDDALRITAVGIFAAEHRAVVGPGKTVLAILLHALVAGMAVPATVDHAAYAGEVAGLEPAHLAADGGHAADDLVARHGWIEGVIPFVARGMQVGMANAAIEYRDLHVLGAGVAALDLERDQRAGGIECRIGFGFGHGVVSPDECES